MAIDSAITPLRSYPYDSSYDNDHSNQESAFSWRGIQNVSDPKLGHVFGVSKQRVLSYLERDAVDGFFKKALASDCHIVVYGSSKQGKTSLVDKNLPYNSNVVVSCTPKF